MITTPSSTDSHARSMLDALLAGNSSRAHAAAAAAQADGLPLVELFDQVLAPGLVEVGARWQGGLVSVTQEKLATKAALSLLARVTPPMPAFGPRWLVATAEGDDHRIGVSMCSAVLADAGCRPDTAYAQTVDSLIAASSSVTGVCLACSGPWSIVPARRAAEAIAATGKPVLVGGGGWAGWEDPPAVVLVRSMAELRERVVVA